MVVACQVLTPKWQSCTGKSITVYEKIDQNSFKKWQICIQKQQNKGETYDVNFVLTCSTAKWGKKMGMENTFWQFLMGKEDMEIMIISLSLSSLDLIMFFHVLHRQSFGDI